MGGPPFADADVVHDDANYLTGYYVDAQADDRSRWPLASSLERQVPVADVLLIYGLDMNPESTYTARRRAILSWQDRGAGDPSFERSLARSRGMAAASARRWRAATRGRTR